jgi:S-DNA-T family DNA segregation ATPase FtsK/SpoIIIE
MLLTLRYLLTFLTVILFIAVVIYVRSPFSDTKTMIRYFFRQKKQTLRLPKEEVAHLYHLNQKIPIKEAILPVPEEPLDNRDILGRPLTDNSLKSPLETPILNGTLATPPPKEANQEEHQASPEAPQAPIRKPLPVIEPDSPTPNGQNTRLLRTDIPLLDLAQIQQNLKKSHPKHATLAPLSPIKDVSSLPVLSHEEIKANLRHLERRQRLRTPSTSIPEVELIYIQEPEKPIRPAGVVHRLSEKLLAPKKAPLPAAPAFSTESPVTRAAATPIFQPTAEADFSPPAQQALPSWQSHHKTTLTQTANSSTWGASGQAQSSANAMPSKAVTDVSAANFSRPIMPLGYPQVSESIGVTTEKLAFPELKASPKQAPVPETVYPNFSSLDEFYPVLPSLALLRPADDAKPTQTDEELLDRGIIIEEKLAEFKVKVNVLDAYAGPIITRYEIEPAIGVRGSQIINLTKDLSRALGLSSIRVVETIPGKTCMGLEVPNPIRQMIRFSEVIGSPDFTDNPSKLAMALGKDITGNPVVVDLAKAPHLLVAGTTGSGKSVGVNSMILSLLFKARPDEVRFIMIDPKMLELSIYNDIPHLLAPVVTDMKLAANALNWCVMEMERRYKLLSAMGVRNLAGFNEKIRAAELHGKKIPHPFSLTPETPEALTPLPFIVVVVDEFADLMMTAGKKIEELIARIAQKARAAGIHLILATQRPSVDVITGLIKANIPTRIAFQVSSKIDSRTILDQMGAESLLGQGDMLFLPPGSGYPQRIHGAFVTDEEVHAIVDYLKATGEPNYIDGLLTGEAEASADEMKENKNSRTEEGDDPLYNDAIAIVLKTRKATISSVQRHLRIGYNRAARMIDQMEADGMVSAMESNGNRTVLAMNRPEPEIDE